MRIDGKRKKRSPASGPAKKKVVFFLFLFVLNLALFVRAEEAGYPYTSSQRSPLAPLVDERGNILIPRDIETGELELKGIIYSQYAPLAVINDEILAVGDKIAGCVIEAISETGVSLNKDGKVLILKMEE